MAARRNAWIVIGLVLLIVPASFAQEPFRKFQSKEDLFAANFPGDPVVTNITWETEYGAKIPGRVYTGSLPGPRNYSVTAVNYKPVQQILTERSKSCDPEDERCLGFQSFPGAGYWKSDVRGAMLYAAGKFLKGDIKLTHIAWSFLGGQGVETNELQFVNNQDKSRGFVSIFMHHSILYIMEETTPANAPPPGLFVASILLKEPDGSMARHYGVYFNGPTVDSVEATTCSMPAFVNGANPEDGDAGAVPLRGVDACKSLPAAQKFQQGPNFKFRTAKPYPLGETEARAQ